jgi:hypothetical protein
MNTVREAAATKSGNPLCDKSHVELTLRVMPPSTSSRNRLATPVTCRRCGMNTVREAAVTKSGNPLMKQLAIPLGRPKTATKWLVICDKSHVELTLRVMPPATETGWLKAPHQGNEVAA